MTFAELKRKPVVSLSDGTKRGEVDDLVVDLDHASVLGFSVADGFLPLAQVRGFGPDALTIETVESLAASPSDKATLHALKELTVVEASGAILGHIDDVSFEVSGGLQSLEVHKGGVLGIGAHITRVPATAIRGIGPKILTVDLPTES